MANNNPGYNLFRDSKGFDTSKLPAPYNTWAKTSTDKSVMSIHNPSAMKATLHRYAMLALLNYADEKNSEIGVVRIADGSYASEWPLPDGSSIIAHATKGGILSAGIRDANTGKMRALPNIGASTQELNDCSILILYLLIEADINAAAGNTTGTITHDLLADARAEFATRGMISEEIARLVCDDLYFALAYGKIPVSIRAGAISLLTDRRLSSNEFSTGTVVCGNPVILTGSSTGSTTGSGKSFNRHTVAVAKALAEPYTATLKWTAEEEMMIPEYPDDTEVPEEVMTILNRFIASREWVNPLNNPCWRGITAFGKSTGVKILACILHTPLLWMTCSTTTETEDFLSKHVPNTDGENELAVGHSGPMPSFDDIENDPAYVYQTLTGVEKPDATCEDALIAYGKVAAASAAAVDSKPAKNPFKIVESDFVQALVKGYIVEVQEFSRIRDPGVLVGLNNFCDPGSVIPLVDGRHVRRHRNAMVVWTDNIGLASCRKVDASVLRRFSYIIDSNDMPKDRALRRIKKNTGCKDDSLLERMYDVWQKIGEYCKVNDITDEGTCSLSELENWVALTQLDGTDAIYDTCRQAVIAKVTSDPTTQKEICDNCANLALSQAGFAS